MSGTLEECSEHFLTVSPHLEFPSQTPRCTALPPILQVLNLLPLPLFDRVRAMARPGVAVFTTGMTGAYLPFLRAGAAAVELGPPNLVNRYEVSMNLENRTRS